MDILKHIKHFYFIERMLVQKKLDAECEKYYNSIEDTKDGFLRKFLLQSVNIGRAVVYDLYLHMKNGSLPAQECFLTRKGIETIFKWAAIYHVVRFLRDKANDVDKNAIIYGVCDLFFLTNDEFYIFVDFVEMSMVSKTEFEILFIKFFTEKALEIQNHSAVLLAFIDNFFYNSYREFVQSFTNFVSIGISVSRTM